MQRLSIAVLAATLLATPAIAQTAAPVVNILIVRWLARRTARNG